MRTAPRADAVVTVTLDGLIRTINQSAKRILHVGDEIVGRSAWETLTFVDAHTGKPVSQDERPLRRALRGENVPPLDIRGVVAASGESVDMRASASPLFDRDGKVRGAVAVFTPSRRLP